MTYTPSGPLLCQLSDVRAALRIAKTDTHDDDRLLMAIDAATRLIQQEAGRLFVQDSTATQRWYVPETPWLIDVDDFQTLAGFSLVTYPAGRQGASQAWTIDVDFQLEPLNALVQQQPWPFETVRAIGSKIFPMYRSMGNVPRSAQALVAITAQWGWANVPADIVQATIIESISIFKSVDVPFGATPFAETGIVRLRPNLHPQAAMLLEPYSRRVMV